MNDSATYEIRLKDSFSSPLKGLETKMNHFENKVGTLKSSFSGLGSMIGGAFAATAVIGGITSLGSKIISLGAQMEQTKVSFETMLGSSKAADGFIKQLQTFANVTPYVTSEVLDAGKQMLAFGFSSGEVIPQLTRLGDVASGLSIPLGDMIYLYGTLKTQGKAMTKDIMQFAQRGIPIYDSLAKVLGVNKNKVGDLVTAGKVGFAQVQKAFELMTAKGSMFGGLMDKQSRTLAGRWSTFEGILETIGTQLGEKLLPLAGKVVDTFSLLADIFPKLDFSPISDVFVELFAPVNDIFNIFRDMLGMFGANIELIDIFRGVIKLLALSFRTVTTGMMVFYTGYKILLQAVKDSFIIWQGLGDIISGVFTLDQTKIYGGINKIKVGFTDLAKHAKDSAFDFVKEQASAYKQLLRFGRTDKEKESELLSGLAKRDEMFSGLRPGGNVQETAIDKGKKDKTKGSGVEKISSGTRNVTVNITKLVETLNIKKEMGRGGDAEMVAAVNRALLTAVNDVNLVQQ